MCANKNKLIRNWFRLVNRSSCRLRGKLAHLSVKMPGIFKKKPVISSRNQMIPYITNKMNIWFDRNSRMTWMKFNSIVFIKFWQKFHFFFFKIVRDSFANWFFIKQSILESTGYRWNSIWFWVSFLRKKWPHVYQLKRFVNDVIHFDVNISIKLNAQCVQRAHIQRCYPSTIRVVLGLKKRATDGWIWNAHCIIYMCRWYKEKHEGDLGSELSRAKHRTWCLIAFLAHVSITIVWSVSESVFSLVLLFAFNTSICIVSTKNSHTHQRMHTNTQTLRNE